MCILILINFKTEVEEIKKKMGLGTICQISTTDNDKDVLGPNYLAAHVCTLSRFMCTNAN